MTEGHDHCLPVLLACLLIRQTWLAVAQCCFYDWTAESASFLQGHLLTWILWLQDSRAVIDAKSAQLLVTNKVKELQQAVQDAAAQNAALVNANLINPEVGAHQIPCEVHFVGLAHPCTAKVCRKLQHCFGGSLQHLRLRRTVFAACCLCIMKSAKCSPLAQATGISMITLTGWVAAAGVAAAAMLGLLGMVWGCRRVSGRDHRYTVIKPRDGDV